jgi:ubiquinol-cytochrome c reductase cytochrome c1 subunit
MGNFDWLGDQAILDAVAYFKSIAPKEMSNKEAYEDACSRCHAMRYDGLKALTDPVSMKNYIGSVPPDLSQMIRSRGEHYLNIFINNPQAILHGTAMPKVGLTKEVQEQVVTYLESVGDRKKAEREALAPWVLGYLVIFTIFAYLWKREKWSEVH